ncbi:MAG: STAS domain-containing protein [Nitrospirae bacterium]|nr:STAS domain-containing protein [Nitrospirota bacterium]
MLLQERTINGVVILKLLEKRLDSSISSDFKVKIMELINGGTLHFVIDLSNVDFIDSSGLGSIVFTLKKLGNEGRVVLCGLQETVFGMFRLTRMDRVIKVYKTEDEALRGFEA